MKAAMSAYGENENTIHSDNTQNPTKDIETSTNKGRVTSPPQKQHQRALTPEGFEEEMNPHQPKRIQRDAPTTNGLFHRTV